MINDIKYKNLYFIIKKGFPGGSVVKNPPANARDAGNMSSVPGSGRSLEEKMATYSSIPAGKISWTEEPGRYSPWVTKSWTRLIN